MDMKLRHHIAERGDIELVALADGSERRRHLRDFLHQLRAFPRIEIDQFDRAGAPRRQDQPRVIRVSMQQEPRQRQIAHRDRVGGELRVERPWRGALRSH